MLPCTRAEAEALARAPDPFPTLDRPPVLNTLEPDATRPEAWRLEAFVEDAPDAATIAAVRALVAGAPEPVVERVPEQDWVTLSQAGLEPIRAGRFFVVTERHADAPAPAGATRFRIDAGLAFGTGHHATTTGCLEALDALARRGRRYRAIADIGTGTGLLAFAALSLWRQAQALATDVDPVSIGVTLANAALNGVRLGAGRGRLVAAVADGVDHPLYEAFGRFDLVTANILAQPLIDLAADIARITAPGGTAILAGLLTGQADAVLAAYRRRGFALARRRDIDDWAILTLRRRPRR